jgi:radical SAM superfamily enzyme YgiQ (UPF0313 family)
MLIENAQTVILTDTLDDVIWSRYAGAYRIATEIRKNDYTCQVIDCFTDLTKEEMKSILSKVIGDKTLFLGISTTFLTADTIKDTSKPPVNNHVGRNREHSYPIPDEEMFEYFDFIKSINPKVKILIGGFKAQYNTAPRADTLITGFADVAVIQYLKYLEGKNPFFTYTLNDYGQMVVDGEKSHENFEFATSDITYTPEDNILNNETMTLEVGRGCIFRCNFCRYVLTGKGKGEWTKRADTIRDEFLKNYYEYGIKNYFYSDDTQNDSVEKLRVLADIVQSLPFKLRYSAYMRLDLIYAKPEQIQLLSDGGLVGAFFGIETLNPIACKKIGKGLGPEKTIETLHRIREKMPHVATHGSLIIGLPGETKETIEDWSSKILREDFPIDAVRFATLGMVKAGEKWLSEFELETPEGYSYEENSDTMWIGPHFDRRWAVQTTNHLNSIAIGVKGAIAGIHNIYVNNTSEKDFSKLSFRENWKEIVELKMDARRRYINKLLSR